MGLKRLLEMKPTVCVCQNRCFPVRPVTALESLHMEDTYTPGKGFSRRDSGCPTTLVSLSFSLYFSLKNDRLRKKGAVDARKQVKIDTQNRKKMKAKARSKVSAKKASDAGRVFIMILHTR